MINKIPKDLLIITSEIFNNQFADNFTKIRLGNVKNKIAGKYIYPIIDKWLASRNEELKNIEIVANKPMRNPKALDVPIAILEDILLLIK